MSSSTTATAGEKTETKPHIKSLSSQLLFCFTRHNMVFSRKSNMLINVHNVWRVVFVLYFYKSLFYIHFFEQSSDQSLIFIFFSWFWFCWYSFFLEGSTNRHFTRTLLGCFLFFFFGWAFFATVFLVCLLIEMFDLWRRFCFKSSSIVKWCVKRFCDQQIE